MKKRNPIVVGLLSIVTFSIYILYWLSSTRKVLNQKTKVKIPTIWLLIAPLIFSYVIWVFVFISIPHNSTTPTYGGTTTSTLCPGTTLDNGGTSTVSCQDSTLTPSQAKSLALYVIIAVLVTLIYIPVSFFWYFKYSKAVDEYTNSEFNTLVTFLLLWFLGFIGIAIIQDKFNKVGDGFSGSGSGAQSPPVAPVGSSPVPPTPPSSPSVVSPMSSTPSPAISTSPTPALGGMGRVQSPASPSPISDIASQGSSTVINPTSPNPMSASAVGSDATPNEYPPKQPMVG